MAAALSAAEAVSMSAVLDDCCEKLAFLNTISPDVNEHKMEESNRIGDEMSRIIAEQRELEDRFEQLIQQRSELKASSNKKRAEENKEEIKEVAKQLKLKTKLLCRNLKDNPNVAENLLKLKTDRTALENLLRLTIEELRDGSFGTLDERVAEDQAEFERIENKKRREQEATLAVKTLQEELETEQSLHASEVTEQAAVISKLKDQLHELRSTSSFSTKLLTKEFAAHIQSQKRQFEKKERDLQAAAAEMVAEKEREKRVNGEIMRFLDKTRKKLAKDLEFWEAKSETDQAELSSRRRWNGSMRSMRRMSSRRMSTRRGRRRRRRGKRRAWQRSGASGAHTYSVVISRRAGPLA